MTHVSKTPKSCYFRGKVPFTAQSIIRQVCSFRKFSKKSHSNDPNFENTKIILLPGKSALYSTINYTTSVQLPEILKKITNIDLSIKVSKKIFIANNKLHAFIDIQKVPVVGFIKISTILSVMETNIILARHMISHGDVPWFARWATDILKKQIVQSVDEYDEVSIRMYCHQQGLQEKHPALP